MKKGKPSKDSAISTVQERRKLSEPICKRSSHQLRTFRKAPGDDLLKHNKGKRFP